MNESTAYRDRPYRNSEGYPDPTAYLAIRNCTREAGTGFMPIVMIFSTERDPEEKLAKKASCLALRMGCIPITPQLMCISCFRQGCRTDQVRARQIMLILLTKCRELWIFGNEEDAFVPRLIDRAAQKGIRTRFFSNDLKEVSDG